MLKEARYALGRRTGDESVPPEIGPLIIEGPPIVPPPAELSALHFNDPLIYFMTEQPESVHGHSAPTGTSHGPCMYPITAPNPLSGRTGRAAAHQVRAGLRATILNPASRATTG